MNPRFSVIWRCVLVGLLWLLGQNLHAQNYVANPGLEPGTSGWSARGTASLLAFSPAYAGTWSLRITGRTSSSSGASTSVLAAPNNHVYRVSAWVRTGGTSTSTINLGIEQVSAFSTNTSTVGSVAASNRWVQVSGLFTLQPTAPLTGLNLYLSGPASGNDLYLDEVTFAPLSFPALEGVLSNPTFELGTTGWAPHGPTTLSLAGAHTGSNALAALNRTATWHGFEQSVKGKLQSGEPYFVSAWVKTTAPTQDTVKVSFRLVDDSGTRYFNAITGKASSADWTWLHGYFTPQTTGTVTDLMFYLEGPVAGVGLIADNVYVGRTAGLRRAAAGYPNFLLGAVVGSSSLQSLNPDYEGTLSGNFHLASTENALKFSSTHPSSNRFTYASANLIADFGQAHGGTTRGHTFVWHQSVPTWVTNGSPTAATVQNILYDHIATVGTEFANRVPWWDVVNEAVNDSNPTGMRSTLWYDQPGIGFAGQSTQYIAEVMSVAHAADPDCELFYNDYSIETVGNKSTFIYNMLATMVTNGVPVKGLGIQAHLSASALTSFNFGSFRSNLQRFGDLGLNLHITEFDLRLPVDTNGVAAADDLWLQGDFYFNFLGNCLAFPSVKVFQMWGFTDAASWIPGAYPGYGAALPLDKNYDRKFAFWGLQNALAGQAEKLPVRASSGDTVSSISDTALSAGSSRRFQANAANDFITLGVYVPFEGEYSVRIGARRASNAGRFQLSVAPATNASFVNLGSAQDTYSSSTSYTSLDLGTNSFPAPGEYHFKFTVPGKNASSSGYELVLDYVRLTPVACRPAIAAVPNQLVRMNETVAPIVFSAEDDIAMGTLQVTASSSDPALVPPTSLVVTARPPFYSLSLQPATNALGTAHISLIASDGMFSTTNRFRLDVYNPTPPSIASARLSGGLMQLTVTNGQAGLLYRIQSSTNLGSWSEVFSTNSPPFQFQWTDPSLPAGLRYYRVVTQM